MQIPDSPNYMEPLSVLIVLLPLFCTYLLTPLYIRWQERKNNLATNYQGKSIVSTGGVIFLISLLVLIIPLHYYFREGKTIWGLLFIYITVVGVLGIIDDLWGEKDCKGFRGHLKKLWHGKEISTGLYKAIGGFLIAVFVSSRLGGEIWPDWLGKALFLALFSNFFNLLDTRPARAAKIFFLISLLLILLGREYIWLLIPFWSMLLIYLYWELETKIMLGDTGAYILGGALGFYGILILPLYIVFIGNALFLILHYYCEKFSLGKFIEDHKSLFFLDSLGRRK
ncbi:MAG: hypothetical protein ACOX6X_02500 [Dethiobacteria bacterium]|jgi:UDP-GlcNAc:undecaprenyl-phosphate GlcNAc-1-phosphate transferase